MKKITSFLLIALFGFSLASCGGNGGYYGGDDGQTNNGGPGVDGDGNQVVVDTGHKIIYTVNYTIHSDEMQNVIKDINAKVYYFEGYISSSTQETDSYADFVYKIPTGHLNEFLDFVDSNEGIGSKRITTEDVTSTYNAIQAQIDTLEASKAAYERMLAEDNLSLDSIMKIRSYIDEINTQLKILYNKRDGYDAVLDYSTVKIHYYQNNVEVKNNSFLSDYPEFLARLGLGIVSFFAYSAPFLIAAGIVCLIIYLVRRKKLKQE
ncbi:MAG: DUF4349 domain-containing protein [Erysipelotrichales bacterium]|nr:DUF4349 domain-containing protein [Erysipelotrichales bacterium]